MQNSRRIDDLFESFRQLGSRRLAVLAGAGLLVMLAVGVSVYQLSRPPMQSIYTGLTPQDVGRITAALAEAGIPFDVNEQRSAVLVPHGQAARSRTLLAQQGLPTSARAGYELFDNMGSLGLTSFMQEVTRVRALEGEIARTIQGLEGVAAARVHLVLAEPGSFRRERREASASVLLRLSGRWQATAGRAVRHIVAAAVPGMRIENVSVASSDGRLIATGGDEQSAGSLKLSELERGMAAELEQKAGRSLASSLGAGNFQVSITVRLDVDMENDAATCHTSVLMLAERMHALQTRNAWLTQWSSASGAQQDRISYFCAIAQTDPGLETKLAKEVERITKIGIDPGELCEFVDVQPVCDPIKLGYVLRALKGRKLIRTGRGLMPAV